MYDEEVGGHSSKEWVSGRVKMALLGILAVLGIVAVPTTAAAGNTTYCNATNLICVYKNADYNTGMAKNVTNFPLANVPLGTNDQMTSWENRYTGRHAAWYYDANGAGSCITMTAGTQNHYVGAAQNDQMSSWKGTGSC